MWKLVTCTESCQYNCWQLKCRIDWPQDLLSQVQKSNVIVKGCVYPSKFLKLGLGLSTVIGVTVVSLKVTRVMVLFKTTEAIVLRGYMQCFKEARLLSRCTVPAVSYFIVMFCTFLTVHKVVDIVLQQQHPVIFQKRNPDNVVTIMSHMVCDTLGLENYCFCPVFSKRQSNTV